MSLNIFEHRGQYIVSLQCTLPLGDSRFTGQIACHEDRDEAIQIARLAIHLLRKKVSEVADEIDKVLADGEFAKQNSQ